MNHQTLLAGMTDCLNDTPSARELVMTDTASGFRWFQHDYPTAIARWNHHPEYELHLIRRSTGRLMVGDYVGRFDGGHLALIGPNLPHDWLSDLGADETIANRDAVLQFDGERLRGGFALFPDMEELAVLLEVAARGIEFTGATAVEASREMEAVGTTSGLDRLSHLFALFAILARSPDTDRLILASPLFATTMNDRMSDVVKYVLAHIDENISQAEAARIAGMSISRFSRTFKRMSGQNFVDFVRKLRVAQACRLLRQTTLPVSSICYDVGFANLSNFNRQFLSEVGASPTNYRRHVREGGFVPCS